MSKTNCLKPIPQQAQQGFTLVELVTVIVLLGIVAIAAVPRFIDSSGFSEFAMQKRLLSALRNMQLKAMYDTRSDFCYKMILNTSASGSTSFGPTSDSYLSGQELVSCGSTIDALSDEFLQASSQDISNQNITFSAVDNVSPITYIAFDNFGKASNNVGTCANSCTISFIGESTANVCVSGEGYIHAC